MKKLKLLIIFKNFSLFFSTFFISQIFLGFIGGVNIGLGYITLSLSLAIIFLIILIFNRIFKKI